MNKAIAALFGLALFCAFFWFGVGRIFTDDRRVLVPLFATVAVVVFGVLALNYCCGRVSEEARR